MNIWWYFNNFPLNPFTRPFTYFFQIALRAILLDIIDTSESSFFYIVFFKNKTKLMQQISQNTDKKLFHFTHCHINTWRYLISLFYYNQLWLYYAQLDTLEEDRQLLGFINSFVDSDDDIFEQERSFAYIFNTFVNQCCTKKDKKCI